MTHGPWIGDYVEKCSEDQYFFGKVVAVFKKVSGAERIVVENPDGVLHIMSAKQLQEVVSHRGNAYLDRISEGVPWRRVTDLSYDV